MVVYKILHKPTNLFFTPSKESGNFSKTGKIYEKKPSLGWLDETMRVKLYIRNKPNEVQKKLIEYFNLDLGQKYFIDKYVRVPLSDWEIITFS